MDNRQKLHQMIDSINSDGTLTYLEIFIRLFIEKFVFEGGKVHEK